MSRFASVREFGRRPDIVDFDLENRVHPGRPSHGRALFATVDVVAPGLGSVRGVGVDPIPARFINLMPTEVSTGAGVGAASIDDQ